MIAIDDEEKEDGSIAYLHDISEYMRLHIP